MQGFGRLLLLWLPSFIFIVSCGAISTGTAGGNTQAKTPAEFGATMRVLWRVSDYSLGANASWGKEEAVKLLSKPLDIDVNYITFDGKTCRNVTFKKEAVKTKEYLANFLLTTPKALGITDEEIEVIRTSCDLPGFGEYLRLKDSRLIIQISGVFFYLEPAVNF